MNDASDSLDAVTVVSVTYNSAHCLPSLQPTLAQCPHVIVVDNASSDDTIKLAHTLLPHALMLRNERNMGFGAANNRALNKVSTPYALLLNPDCELGIEAVTQLVQAMQHWPSAAMLAPQLLDGNARAQLNYRWSRSAWKSTGPGADAPCCVGFVTGAAILLNMAVMREIGFFDEDFFLYYEDDDLCERVFARHKQIIIDPSIRVLHRSRGSVRGKSRWRPEYLRGYHHAQSKVIYVAKHQSLARARRLRWRVLSLALLSLPLRCLVPQPKYVARLCGRIAGLINQRWPQQPAQRPS